MVDVMAERCDDCDKGLIDFCFQYRGKARGLFDLCVRHKLILEDPNKRLHIFLQEAAALYNPYTPNRSEETPVAASTS